MLIKNKIILLFTALVITIQVIFSLYVYYYYSFYRQQEFQSRLTGKAQMSARLFIKNDSIDHQLRNSIKKGDLVTLVNEKISIYDKAHNLLYTNRDDISQTQNRQYLSKIQPGDILHFTEKDTETIGMYYHFENKQYIVFASAYDWFGFTKLYNLKSILIIGNIIVFVLTIFAAWFFANHLLQPIAAMVDRMAQITEKNLHARLHEGNKKDEIAKLSITFNQMLNRLMYAFESQKSFVSHASHELRTPISNILGTLETSLAYDHTHEDYRKSIVSSIEEIIRVKELTNGLLQLAKLDNVSNIPAETVRVDEAVLTAVSSINAKYPAQKINISLDSEANIEENLTLVSNFFLLVSVFQNIIDNACRYSRHQPVNILIDASETDHSIGVTIIDSGRGMSQNDMNHIFEPLYRGEDTHDVPGYGIGMALCKKIIDLYHGEIIINSTVGERYDHNNYSEGSYKILTLF